MGDCPKTETCGSNFDRTLKLKIPGKQGDPPDAGFAWRIGKLDEGIGALTAMGAAAVKDSRLGQKQTAWSGALAAAVHLQPPCRLRGTSNDARPTLH